MDSKRLDPVLTYLIAVNLAEFEDKYRGYLQIAGAGEEPTVRHFAIATLAMMLEMALVPPHVGQFLVAQLGKQTDEELKEGCIAIVNGTHLIITKGVESNTMVILPMLRPTTEPPRYTLTSTMYFVRGVWTQATDVLAGKA